jgi:hypothetical protein
MQPAAIAGRNEGRADEVIDPVKLAGGMAPVQPIKAAMSIGLDSMGVESAGN